MNLIDIYSFFGEHKLNGNEVAASLVILRNITIESIDPYIKYYGAIDNLNIKLEFGNYDNALQDSLDSKKINDKTEFIILALKLEKISDRISNQFISLSENELLHEEAYVGSYIKSTIENIRTLSKGIIIINSFEYPLNPIFGVIDSSNISMQMAVYRRLNDMLIKIVQDYKDVYIFDLNQCLARIGEDNYYDYRYWQINQAPYTLIALEEMARGYLKFIKAKKGMAKKCLVLDCDNTIWGGIVGEDGIDGIKLGGAYPGSAFHDFHKLVLELYSKGVIIAVCSKNNENDVMDVLDNHPESLIRRKHISAYRINWQDKASNLKEIADELNIGLDSMVFVDDSSYEIDLINKILPQVATVQVKSGEEYIFKHNLIKKGFFDGLSFTAEDRDRGEMYAAEIQRKKYTETRSINLDEFLLSLNIEVSIEINNKNDIPRIAQLTQKTNQFNLTTRRYSEVDINDFMTNSSSRVLTARLRDRFGEVGLIGVLILTGINGNENAHIDSFLLSCRALGRGVDDALLEAGIEECANLGCNGLSAEYIKTPKNSQVSDFFIKKDFKENHDFGENKKYYLKLTAFKSKQSGIIKVNKRGT